MGFWCIVPGLNLADIKPFPAITSIVIYKNKRLMHIYHDKQCLKTYKIALGFAPIGRKTQEGDGKTPEGTYKITAKNPNSKFYRSLRISYPNASDRKSALKRGVSPGSDIMIHGLGSLFNHIGALHVLNDWTLGCIAVTDSEILEIYTSVSVGIPVIIYP